MKYWASRKTAFNIYLGGHKLTPRSRHTTASPNSKAASPQSPRAELGHAWTAKWRHQARSIMKMRLQDSAPNTWIALLCMLNKGVSECVSLLCSQLCLQLYNMFSCIMFLTRVHNARPAVGRRGALRKNSSRRPNKNGTSRVIYRDNYHAAAIPRRLAQFASALYGRVAFLSIVSLFRFGGIYLSTRGICPLG